MNVGKARMKTPWTSQKMPYWRMKNGINTAFALPVIGTPLRINDMAGTPPRTEPSARAILRTLKTPTTPFSSQ